MAKKRSMQSWVKMPSPDQAVRYLNSHPMVGAPRNIRQAPTAPLGYANWFFRIFPFDELGLHFVEARIRNASRWVGCPNPPDAYIINNNGEITEFREDQYGDAVVMFAELVKGRETHSHPPKANAR